MLNLENHKNIKAIHILKDNESIFRKYREDFDDTQLYPVGCIFKSYLSILVGIAIYEGKIRSINDRVIDYFPIEEAHNLEWEKLRIKHVLSKITGIVWPDPKESLPENMEKIMQLEFESEPGEIFKYKPDPHILVHLLEALYGVEITKILELKLLSHFRNTAYQWDRESDNMLVSISSLDDLGQLLLYKGMIREKRLFSENYYEDSIRCYSSGGFPEFNSYGLGWWISNYVGISYFYAAGFGGQLLAIIPQKKITVSILSDMDKPHPENKRIIELLIES